MKKFVVSMLALFSVIFILAGCGNKVAYQSADDLQTALEDGKKVEGKTVKFKINEVEPNGLLGYAISPDNSLGFVSDKAPDVELKKGDTVTVKIKSAKLLMGTWVIRYDNLKKVDK